MGIIKKALFIVLVIFLLFMPDLNKQEGRQESRDAYPAGSSPVNSDVSR